MPIVGFNIEKINAEKIVDKIKGNVNINTNLNILNIEEEKIPIAEKSGDILKFKFEFDVKYEPKVGNINIKGNVLYLDEPKVVKDVLKAWKKNKEIPKNIMEQLFNTILLRCNIKALDLSQEIGLPPHLRLPRVASAVKPESYVG